MIAHVRWHEALRTAVSNGERAVLVTVAAGTGSTPRDAGAAMVVTSTLVAGTIGGGHLEYEALRLAHEALATPGPSAQWLVRFPLAARLGQCCGGVATLSFATLDASALSWLDVVEACARASTPFAVVGHVKPGVHAGDRLVVTADDARGSLGDAALDSAAVAQARARLALPADERRGDTGVVSAGGDTLFVHVVRADAFPICVFGNGHVGRALVQVLGAVPADVRWIDTREHDFPAQVPANVEVVVTDDPTAEVAAAPRGACLVVMTHSHPLDFDIVETALARSDWAYIGLIGSKSKRAQFERRLLARGAAPESLLRVTCPIGAGPLRSKVPGVIAVAVAAELLAVRESSAAKPVSAETRGVRPQFRGVARLHSKWTGENGV
jgi:xanthine dehydrogenase accessory factor